MVFTVADNVGVRHRKPVAIAQSVYKAGDGSLWETTGLVRHAEPGEHVLGPLGVAEATKRTAKPYPILRRRTA